MSAVQDDRPTLTVGNPMVDRMLNWRHPDIARDTATAMDIAEAACIPDGGKLPLTALVVAIQYGRARGISQAVRGGNVMAIIMGAMSGFSVASALFAIGLWIR